MRSSTVFTSYVADRANDGHTKKGHIQRIVTAAYLISGLERAWSERAGSECTRVLKVKTE